MSKGAFHGIVTPILTPYNDDQSNARDGVLLVVGCQERWVDAVNCAIGHSKTFL